MGYNEEYDEEEQQKGNGIGESILRDAGDAAKKKIRENIAENKNNDNRHAENTKNSSHTPKSETDTQKANAGTANKGAETATKTAAGAKDATEAANAAGTAASAGSQAASTGTQAATAAAGSTGVGIPVAVAIQIADKTKKTADKIKKMDEFAEQTDDNGLIGKIITGIGLVILLFIFYVGSMIQYVIPGPIESYRESQYFPNSSLKNKFTKKGYPTVQNVINEYNGLEEYNGKVPVEDAAIVYKKLIDAAIKDIFESFCEETLDKYDKNILIRFFTGDDMDRDDTKTKEEFLKQPYPYCKKNQDGRYYTIEEFLNGDIPEYDENNSESYLNDDVNYAEIIAIMGMNPKFNIMSEDCTIEDFAELLCSERTKKYLYEFKASPVFLYKQLTDANGNTYYSNSEDDIEGYYYTFEIKPYGLRELFVIAEVDKFGQDTDFTNQTNYGMLDRREEYFRTYARTSEYILGPSYKEERSKDSIIYGESGTRTKTGRSADYYIQDADNLGEESILEEWDTPEKPPVTPDYDYNGEAVILDMYEYINQGTCSASQMKRGDGTKTIQQAGCIDCTYIMIAEYYLRKTISVASIASNKSMYNGNEFNTWLFMKTYNMEYLTSSFVTFDIDKCRDYIDKGMPIVLHIKGRWEYNGTVYHKSENGHFLIIMGYDNNGLYVYDPGSTNNTTNGPIPYEAFNYVNEKYLRDPYIKNKVNSTTNKLQYSFREEKTTVKIPGISKTYKIAWISDMHIVANQKNLDDVVNGNAGMTAEEYINQRYSMFKTDDGKMHSEELWKEVVKYINEGNFDAVIFGGDMLDYYSEANIKALQTGLSNIKSNVPWVYIYGSTDDHDAWTGLTGTDTNAAMGKVMSMDNTNGGKDIIDLGEFKIIGLNNSANANITAEAAETKSQIENAGKPVILATHVPFESKIQSLKTWSKGVHNDQIYYWADNSYKWTIQNNAAMKEFLETCIYATDTNVVQVLGGHIHMGSWDGKLTNQVDQHVFQASYRGTIGVITVSP